MIIILDRVERLIQSEYDQKFLLNLLDKLFNNQTKLRLNLKLILTFSIDSDNDFKEIFEPILKNTTNQISLRKFNLSVKCISNPSLSNSNIEVNKLITEINQNLTKIFEINNFADVNKLRLVEILLLILTKSRYGLKQCEIIDILRLYYKTNHQINQLYLDYLITITWYAFKNYTLIKNEPNLIEILTDNNQTLYRLKSNRQSNESFCKSISNETEIKLTSLLTTFYQSVIDRTTCQSISSNRLFISYLVNRAYQELPQFSYLNYQLQQQQQQQQQQQLNKKSIEQQFASNFILNHKWILNKSLNIGNVFYYLQDLEKFSRIFRSNSETPNEDDFDEFQRLIYKIVFSLYQDPNQLFLQLKSYIKVLKNSKNLTFLNNLLNELNKTHKAHNLPQLTGLNYENFIQSEDSKSVDSPEKVAFNTLDKHLTYFSKVIFLGTYLILGMSDSHNEIKIWQINTTENSLKLIRSIKLNRPPRDLRLLNKHTAVVLVERNLHLFDLNKCEHMLDMNTTMSANHPFFEIHDQNHVVFLARNRLSVILMKISPPTKNKEITEDESNYTADNMFLFKVGEDRFLNSMLVSRNGQIMVCGDEVQKPFPLLVWNLDKRKLVHDLRQAKHEFITSIQAIGSSGRFMVCACQVN